MPTGGPLLIQSPALKHWGHACSGGYVATRPTSGPLLILAFDMKSKGTPKWRWLGSHQALLWATSVFVPFSEAVGIPETAGVM